MSTSHTFRSRPSSQQHAERLARHRERTRSRSLPDEKPIERPIKPCLSVEAANDLFDKYFRIHREN